MSSGREENRSIPRGKVGKNDRDDDGTVSGIRSTVTGGLMSTGSSETYDDSTVGMGLGDLWSRTD